MRALHSPVIMDFGFDPSVVLDECYEYVCGITCGRIHKVSKRKHSNIQKGKLYYCPHCKKILKENK